MKTQTFTSKRLMWIAWFTWISFGLLILFFTSCMSGKRLVERKAAKLQFRTDKKCAKALKNYEAKSYKLGCSWMNNTSESSTSTSSIRDTTVPVSIPGVIVHDSIPVIIIQGIMNSKVMVLETPYSRAEAWVTEGILKLNLQQKQSTIAATIKGAIKETTATKAKTIRVPYPVEKQVKMPLSWLQKLFVWSGAIAWGLAIAFCIFKFRKQLSFKSSKFG